MREPKKGSDKTTARSQQIAFRVAPKEKSRAVRIAGGKRKLSDFARRTVMEAVELAEQKPVIA